MLQADTELKRSLIGMEVLNGELTECDVKKTGIDINGFISYDSMNEILRIIKQE